MPKPYSQEPPPPPVWDYQPSAMIEIAERLIATSEKVWNQVAKINPTEATFKNAIIPIIDDEQIRNVEGRILGFLGDVSTDKDVRDAARKVSLMMARVQIEWTAREDVFRVVDAVWNKKDNLDPESQIYLEKFHNEFVYNGLNLPNEADRLRLKAMRKKMAELSKEYIANMNNDPSGIWLTEQEIKGVSKHHIDRWRAAKEDADHKDMTWVNFKRPSFAPFMESASNSDARRKYWIASENRFKDANGLLQRELVLLRDEAARLLGYKNHAEIKSEERMLNPDLVLGFLTGLREQLTSKGKAEIDDFARLKSAEAQNSSTTQQEDADKIFLWDRSYFNQVSKEQDLEIDSEKVAEYFSFDLILPKMFLIYEALFGMRFVKTSASVEQGTTWHENVTLYTVWDDEGEGGDFLGYLYIDPYPRANKYGHFGNYRLIEGSVGNDGTRTYPSVVFLANYPPPTSTRSSLLTYRDVVNCFHELGHSVANLVCRAKYSKCRSTTRDFGEIPSILLENLFNDPNIIRFVSCHYANPSEDKKIPEEMIQQLIDGSEKNAALPALWLVFQSLFDLTIHSPPDRQTLLDMNLAAVFNKIRKETVMIYGTEAQGKESDFVQGNTHFRAIMGSYDVGYYTYLTSKAYAFDIFTSIFAPLQTKTRTEDVNEIVNEELKKMGRKYRYSVLEPGGKTGDQWQLLVDFLGREPTFEAFGNLEKFRV